MCLLNISQVINESEIIECENDFKRKHLFFRNYLELDLLETISKKLIEHGRVCIYLKNYYRLDTICHEMKKALEWLISLPGGIERIPNTAIM